MKNEYLENGYDYTNQAWVKNGFYLRCGHPPDMKCHCYGRVHEGQICQITRTTNGKED